MQKNVLPGHPWAWMYFASFIVLAVFVVVNLFIAVVINNLETAKEQESAHAGERVTGKELEEHLRRAMLELKRLDAALKRRPERLDQKPVDGGDQ